MAKAPPSVQSTLSSMVRNRTNRSDAKECSLAPEQVLTIETKTFVQNEATVFAVN